jgi:hypothetical protein
MLDRISHFSRFSAQLVTFGVVVAMLPIEAVWPQAAPQPTLGLQSPAQQSVPPQPEPQQIAPSPREENPGLINEIEKLFEKSKSLLPSLKSPSEAIDDFNARAKGAGESLSTMTKPSIVVSGRAACTVAANGAPDCKAGADRLCQSKEPQGRQEPGHGCGREMLAESVPARPQTRAGRLQDRKLRDAGGVPVAPKRNT